MNAAMVSKSAIVEVDGGVIVRVSDDLKVISIPNNNKSVRVSNEELTVIDRQLWVQWTQALPAIFQSAVDAIGLSGVAYSDMLAAQLLEQMEAMDTGIHNSLQIYNDAVAQQLTQIVNNHNSLAGIVDTKITQADADGAIAIAISDMAVQIGDSTAQNFVSKTSYATDKTATTQEISSAKSEVLESVALNYVEKTTYVTDQSAAANQISEIAASVVESEARIVQSYTVYVDENLSYDVKVYSSNGSMFKNGVIDTDLTAKVFKGKDDITSTLAAGLFTWTRVSADSLTDPLWNATKIGVGSVLHITTADVFSKAVFSCFVTLT